MSRQPQKKSVPVNARKKAPAVTPPVLLGEQSPSGGGSLQKADGTVHDVVLRMHALLSERIERTRDKLRSTGETVARLPDHEAKIGRLESEIQALRKSDKGLEIRVNQLDAENASLRTRLSSLQASLNAAEKSKDAAETKARSLEEAVGRLYKMAGKEVGRAVRVLLAGKKSSLLRTRPSLSKQAKLLVDGHIVDPAWYLSRHPDVVAAGMDPAVHYLLHGAEEGRVACPGLDDAAREG